jgi:nucleotide-binding universal stress UspA family protein
MDVLVPIDGSDCSERALRFAVDFAERYGGQLSVVHITDEETDATERILERAERVLDEEGGDAEPSLALTVDLEFKTAAKVGKDIIRLVESEGFDHVVMGHHGSGAIETAILGSAAQTVVSAEVVPVTVVP